MLTTKGENNEIRGQMLLYFEDGGELEGSLQTATSTLPLQWLPYFQTSYCDIPILIHSSDLQGHTFWNEEHTRLWLHHYL